MQAGTPGGLTVRGFQGKAIVGRGRVAAERTEHGRRRPAKNETERPYLRALLRRRPAAQPAPVAPTRAPGDQDAAAFLRGTQRLMRGFTRRGTSGRWNPSSELAIVVAAWPVVLYEEPCYNLIAYWGNRGRAGVGTTAAAPSDPTEHGQRLVRALPGWMPRRRDALPLKAKRVVVLQIPGRRYRSKGRQRVFY